MARPTILLADDDDAVCVVITHALTAEGYDVRRTADFAELMAWVEAGDGDALISDVVMPSGNGLQMLPHIKAMRPDLPVMIISAQNTLMTAVKSTEGGAFDYLPKPFDLDELCAMVARALQPIAARPMDALPTPEHAPDNLALIGTSPAMQEVFKSIARLVGNDLTVMIAGESGTGKELVARSIHALGSRKDAPFVAVNMGAIPKELVESELFGHEKGAFTGAVGKQQGRFAQAEGGTLFLDEIGDMPLMAQTSLLRVLQQGEYTPVGGGKPVQTHLRIMCATHRDLAQMVQEGAFREDLYYRLNVVPLKLPPLRERTEDIADLAHKFLQKAAQLGLGNKHFSEVAMQKLMHYSWPGNVRELENVVLRVAAMCPHERVDVADVAQHLEPQSQTLGLLSVTPSTKAGPSQKSGLEQTIRQHIEHYFATHDHGLPPAGLYDRMLVLLEKPLIEETLRATGGNQLRAAHLLGINRNTLRKKMQVLGLKNHQLLPAYRTGKAS